MPDAIIRDGVRAMLAQCEIELEQRLKEQEVLGWTAYQHADRKLIEQLRRQHDDWSELSDEVRRQAAVDQFHRYAYQWY